MPETSLLEWRITCHRWVCRWWLVQLRPRMKSPAADLLVFLNWVLLSWRCCTPRTPVLLMCLSSSTMKRISCHDYQILWCQSARVFSASLYVLCWPSLINSWQLTTTRRQLCKPTVIKCVMIRIRRQEFNVDWKADCRQLNLTYVTKNRKNIKEETKQTNANAQ